MKTFKFILVALAFIVSAQANAWSLLKGVFSNMSVDADSTLYFGEVVSMEPVNMKEYLASENNPSYTSMAGMQAGATVSGGSVKAIVLGGVIGYVADTVKSKTVKQIDGYKIVVITDGGEKIVALNRKGQAEDYDVAVGKRVSVIKRPTDTLIMETSITKEEAPAEIARRAPHQVQAANAVAKTNPTESAMASEPSEKATPVADSEEAKTTLDTISTPKAVDAPSHAASSF